MGDVERSAVISVCGLYRYALQRIWDQSLPILVFLMLNPSTADAAVDDATIRVCMGRARLMGAGGIAVVNLFAYRATQPADMLRAVDPVGPENDMWIDRVARDGKTLMVIAAYGAHGAHRGRATSVKRKLAGVQLYHLGRTKGGFPKHPLRIAYSVQPEPLP